MKLSNARKVLVTGGAGFIGSAVVWALNQRGIDNILVVDKLSDDDRFRYLIPLKFNDYLEADALLKLIHEREHTLDDVGTVIHLGACASTTERDCSFLIANNYEYTKTLAAWALRKHVRFVYASSAATYGDGKREMDDFEADLSIYRPLNAYAFSKQLFDRYASTHGVLNNIYGVKYFNVFGPNEYHKADMSSMALRAFQQIQQTGKVKLFKSRHADYADGCQLRDFVYIHDAVEMTLHLAETDATGGIFNVGSGHASTWIDLVTPVFKAMDKPVNIEYIDMPDSLAANYQYFTQANIAKIRQTGYTTPTMPLKEAVTDYVKNYLLPNKRLGE